MPYIDRDDFFGSFPELDIEPYKSFPTADVVETPRWIPVSERLPIPNEHIGNVRKYYLIQDEYGDMLTASYNKRADGIIYWEQMYDIEPLHYEVVAWMELPEPYRKETENAEIY